MILSLLSKIGDDLCRTTLLSKFCKTLKTKFKFPINQVAIDSTGFPNAGNVACIAIGDQSRERYNEIRILHVADRETGMPLYYRAYRGHVTDMKTLKTTFMQLEELSVLPEYVVVDDGYSCKECIDLYNQYTIDFLSRVPASSRLFKDLVASHLDGMLNDPNNIVQYQGRGLSIKCIQALIEGTNRSFSGYAYICVDWERRQLKSQQHSVP